MRTALPLLLTVALATTLPAQTPDPKVSPKRPRLIVCLAVDQLRGDYLERFAPYFSDRGLRRIEREGRVQTRARYEYSYTVTAPGHATMMTGVNPNEHGITGNHFFDRAQGKAVYNCWDETTPIVDGNGPRKGGGFSPRTLLVPTAGDHLEAATRGEAKTLAVAIKDRGAILMGGHSCDEAFWFDSGSGRWVTSTYYAQKTPAWLEDLQGPTSMVAEYKNATWDLSLLPEDYARHQTEDAQAGEANGPLGIVFPKKLGSEVNRQLVEQVISSPFGDRMTFAVAMAGIRANNMGADEVPDLVAISLSSFDIAGHAYGPDSWEMMDFTIKLDAELGDFLEFLDNQVGAGQYSLLISADHGVAPLPEVMAARRIPAGRIPGNELADDAETFLEAQIGPAGAIGRYIVDWAEPYWVLNPKLPRDRRDLAVTLLKEWAVQQEGIARAYSREQLEAGSAGSDRILAAAQHSYHAARSGDVMLVVRPFYFFSSNKAGTTHSAPYTYDQNVPLLGFGFGLGAKATSTAPADLFDRHSASPTGMGRLVPELLHNTSP